MALAEILRKKRNQIDVDGHDRVLIGRITGMPVDIEDVTTACAFIDFAPFSPIDRIYLERSEGDFRLVYDQSAWRAMEQGFLPSDGQQRCLVVTWVEARMAFHWPSGLEFALRVSWDQGSIEWLSKEGRHLMEVEGRLFLQNCGWKAPGSYWELHHGPSVLIADGRRRILPITA